MATSATRRTAKPTKPRKTVAAKTAKKPSAKKTGKPGKQELRIRMYRVGFGDFFLVTVPSAKGPQHIVIDCGVTRGKTGKGDIASLKTAVRHMAATTEGQLALIIMTHRHQDHIIGFSRCEEEFEKFKGKVGAIWMPYWETEYPKVKQFQDDLEAVALQMRSAALTALAASPDDPTAEEIRGITENATGVTDEGPGGGTNKRSLDMLKRGLGVAPKYYAKGDTPELPEALVKAGLTAAILGPPPANEFDFLKMMDLKKGVGQYLDAVGVASGRARLMPFAREFIVDAREYPANAFREWTPRATGKAPDNTRHDNALLEAAVKAATPDGLLMAAKKLDAILNNQSLVVLFTWNGKRLLFAGDAQAGNWLSWLFDLDNPVKDPSDEDLTAESREILGSLAFYKVGHHGSTNATPISAVEAMGGDFVSMCSTQADTFGNPRRGTEVPRMPLLEALAKKSVLVRSDHYPAQVNGKNIPPVKGAPEHPPQLKQGRGRLEVGDCYVDYFI